MPVCDRCDGKTYVIGTDKLGNEDPTAPTEGCPKCDSTGVLADPVVPEVEPLPETEPAEDEPDDEADAEEPSDEDAEPDEPDDE